MELYAHQKILLFLSVSNKPMIIGGGLSSHKDLRNISNLKASLLEGVIAGKSFYLGKTKIKTALSILSNNA